MKKINYFLECLKAFWHGIKNAIAVPVALIRMARMKQPLITIFGGTGAYEQGKYVRWAHDLAAKLAKQGMTVVTGGGPGIMDAANCGAFEGSSQKNGYSLGIGVNGVDEGHTNGCSPVITVDTFNIRKALLMRYASAFVLFPGGIGTVDEFFEVLNLIKLKRIQKVPIVLMGVSYWKDLIAWYMHAFEYEFIEEHPQSMFIVTDDVDEAVKVIVSVKHD